MTTASLPLQPWPALPLAAWRATRDTLHMLTQIVGKIRLARAPMEPEWAQVPLYVTSRGLTTSPMPDRGRTFQIDLDLLDPAMVITTSDAEVRAVPLRSEPVADTYARVMEALDSLGIRIALNPLAVEVPDPVRLDEDRAHAQLDAHEVTRFFQVLTRVDTVMKTHRARFWGKHTPVQFFWGTFDLAYVRYSGRPASPPAGRDRITRVAMDAEEIAAGFWPGDDRHPAPAFFVYGYPHPPALDADVLGDLGAAWNETLGEVVLPYERVRASARPDQHLLDFLQRSYEAYARAMGWDLAALDRDRHLPRIGAAELAGAPAAG